MPSVRCQIEVLELITGSSVHVRERAKLVLLTQTTTEELTCPWRIHRSCSNRGLVQSATVPLPAVGAELNGRCRAFNGRLWHTSCKPGVRTMAIIVMLEIDELCFQIGAGPEEHSVQVLAANGSD